jgi:hypothetical protein
LLYQPNLASRRFEPEKKLAREADVNDTDDRKLAAEPKAIL